MTTNDAPILALLREAADDATVGKVFGSPIHHEGLIVLPVAKVSGGGGGGSGTGPGPDGQENGGTGGGYGMSAKPLGVFVLRNGRVTWRPAIDVNRVVLGGQIVAITGLLVLRALIKSAVVRPQPRRRVTGRTRCGTRTATAPVQRLRRLTTR